MEIHEVRRQFVEAENVLLIRLDELCIHLITQFKTKIEFEKMWNGWIPDSRYLVTFDRKQDYENILVTIYKCYSPVKKIIYNPFNNTYDNREIAEYDSIINIVFDYLSELVKGN